MSYGRTPHRGHGRRKPAHRWAEDYSFLDRRDRHCRDDIYDFPDWYYINEHSHGPWYLEASEDMERLIFLLASMALYAAGWFLVFLVSRLFRLAKRRRSQAEAFEETCRQHLRRRRTECVRGEPTPEQLLAAWEESRTSLAGKLRLGALLSEIEPHVDQSLIRDEAGHIVGRRPGILGWLRWNCPELVPHYKAVMAYKALADKVQMAIGLQSKYSIVDVIDVFIEFGFGGAAATRESAFEIELRGPREKLREVLRALSRRTMKALDC